MSKFNDNLTKFSNDFNEFITTFLELDDKAPFDNNLLKAIQETFTDSISTIKNTSKHLDQSLNNYSVELKGILNEYYSKIDTLKNNIIKEKNEITNIHDQTSLNLSNDIKKLNEENTRKKEAHEIDIDYFIISSNQNIDMFELEHEDNITRYNYQSESAKSSYQNSISKNNTHLDSKLKKTIDEYAFSLIDYDNETKNIIDGYNAKIDEKNKLLDEYVEKFTEVIAEHKARKHEESIDLNTKIRKLSNETIQQNVQERKEYNTNQNNNQKEKDQKRSEYQLESQSISREFVLKMTELDESISKIKNDYNNNLSNEQKDLQYRLLDIHKEQEKAISNIVYSNNINDKIRKRQIKKNNRAYFYYSNLEKEQSKKTINNLNKAFTLDSENNTYNKKILELNRSYSIKSINEKELHDNKYYQELNNIDENILNYKLSIINNQFNKKANLIRLASTLRNIDIDSNFDKQDALHQIELEKLSTDIKCAKIDLESLQKIHKLLHETEDTKHQKHLNYLVVYNLLEIEKNRVLNDYNNNQYKLNVEKENELLKYSTTNIKLKNYKYKQLKYSKMAIEKAILDNDVYALKYKDLVDNINKSLEISSATINNQFEQDKLFVDVLNKKFRKELKSINQILSSYINAITELKNNISTILDQIFDNIIFRPEYLDIITSFIDRLLKIAFDYFEEISQTFLDMEKDVINDRLEFEQSFKFSLEYETIEKVYNKEHQEIISKKQELDETLDTYQKKINEYNSLIFTIQNQILYIKDPKNFALYNKQSAKKNLSLLTNKIDTITEQANTNIKMMEPLKAEIQRYENKLNTVETNYSNRIADIKRKQYISALAYHNLSEDLQGSVNEVKKSFTSLLSQQKDNKISVVNYDVVLNKKQNDINNIMNNLISNLYEDINTFFNAENKEQVSNQLEIEEIHKMKINEANFNHTSTLNYEKFKATKIKKNLTNEIRNKNIGYNNVERRCDALIKKNNNNHIKNSNNIIEKTTKATETFYDEFYAICANQESITTDYEDTVRYLENNYRDSVNEIVANAKNTKENLKNELNNYILKRKKLINDLPEKSKLEKYNSQVETKKYNRDMDKNSAIAKTNFINKRKELNNNLSEINTTFGKTILQLNNEHKSQLKKEKKYHSNQLRHIR